MYIRIITFHEIRALGTESILIKSPVWMVRSERADIRGRRHTSCDVRSHNYVYLPTGAIFGTSSEISINGNTMFSNNFADGDDDLEGGGEK